MSAAERPSCALAFGQLQADGAVFGIDKGVDLGCQAAARATHATGSLIFFGRWRHVDERGSTRRRSSGYRHRKQLIRLAECAPNDPPCATG
jgi:hypothetical protein